MSFFDTTLGKVIKTALWSGASAFFAVIVIAVQAHPDAFVFYGISLVPFINILGVFIKNFTDPSVKNLP